ncbi:beta-amylase 7 [Fagus crenata]
MKEPMEVGEASGSHQGRTMRRTETEKEKTKMRERQRRAITTKIFQGLRKHGGYRLSPRADINELLRNLASEAGWVVLPDGTTYRSSTSNVLSCCPVCGSGITSNNTTPCSSVVVGGGGGGGEYCSSTTASYGGSTSSSSMYISHGGLCESQDHLLTMPDCDNVPLELYIYDGLPGGLHHHQPSAVGGGCVGGGPLLMGTTYPQQQQGQLYVQEARASNQNTPVGSPLHQRLA